MELNRTILGLGFRLQRIISVLSGGRLRQMQLVSFRPEALPCITSQSSILRYTHSHPRSGSTDQSASEPIPFHEFPILKQQQVNGVVDEKTFSGYIPIKSLSITYSRSSGPGGQHVNKTCSKVDVRFHLANAEWLSDYMKSKLQEKKPNHLNKDGYFVVKSEKTKSQQLNVADCLDKLRSMIRDAIKEPVGPNPLTLERRRRLLEQHARARLREKRAHSLIKQLRQSPSCA